MEVQKVEVLPRRLVPIHASKPSPLPLPDQNSATPPGPTWILKMEPLPRAPQPIWPHTFPWEEAIHRAFSGDKDPEAVNRYIATIPHGPTYYRNLTTAPTKERRKKERKKERKKNEILAKNANVTINNNTAVKHWFPLSSYCLVLQFHLVLFPKMSASQPFRKGSGEFFLI